MATPNNIIIKKVKKGGHGHHGGAWKVAYADFVTAMMAFFLLMWLLASTPQEKLTGIADFFAPTVGLRDSKGIGVDGGSAPDAKDGTNKSKNASQDQVVFSAETSGAIVKDPDHRVKAPEENDDVNFSHTQHDLYKAIEKSPDLQDFKDSIKIEATPEGLKVELLDKKDKPMFYPGTSKLEPYMEMILRKVSTIIKFLPNYISISGHTNSARFNESNTIDNWTLSSDRANVTRHFLVDNHLIDYDQITRIVGKADQEPLDFEHPENISNMRVELLLMRQSLVPFQKKSAPENDKQEIGIKDQPAQKLLPDGTKPGNPKGPNFDKDAPVTVPVFNMQAP